MNDDEVMREITLSFLNCDNNQTNLKKGLEKKQQMIDDGISPVQLDRCARTLMDYYMKTGEIPPYDKENDDEKYI